MSHPSASDEILLRRLANEFPKYRYNFRSEKEFHEGIAAVLDAIGVAYVREHSASGRDRFDFLVAGGIVIEAKVQGSEADATLQVHRYLQLKAVRGVVIVTTRFWGIGRSFHKEWHGKRFEVVHLKRQAF